MAKKRVTRKELVKKPDEFITLSGTVIQWARSNAKALTYGAVAFFALVVLVAGYRYYTENRERAAASLLSRSMTAYEDALRAQKEPSEALEMVQPDLEELISTFGGYDAGRLGRLFYAHINLSAGMADQAIEQYNASLDDLDGREPLVNTALNGLAMAYLRKGDTASAIAHFEKVLDAAGTVLKDTALFNLGSLYAAEGDPQKSMDAYQRLTTEFPNSIYADIAREKRAG